MRQTVAQLAEKFIKLEIIVLAFLLPIFFLPVTAEFFDFNKLMFLGVAVLLGWLAWGAQALALGRVQIRRNPFDLPVAFLWLVTVISTILSDSWLISIIGQYARWQPSLVSVTVLALFYFLVSWNITKETLKKVVYALLASGAVAAVLFIPQYFGANVFGRDWSKGQNFTPLGSVTTLVLFLGSLSGIAIHRLLISGKTMKVALSIYLVLTAAVLVFANYPTGWVALAVSVAAAIALSSLEDIKKNKWHLLFALGASVVIALSTLVPPLFGKSTFLNTDFPREAALDMKTSWSVSATSFRQKPLAGSGPSTFLTDFTRYKPLSFNQSPFWSLRFEKPLNEYLLAFAEEGILGILAWLFILGTLIKVLLAHKDELLPVAAAVLAGFFLTPATVASSFILIVALASLTAAGEKDLNPKGGAFDKKLLTLFLVILGLTVWALFWAYKVYAGEYHLKQALNTQDNRAAYNQEILAIQSFSWRAEYHMALARTTFALASELASKKDLTKDDQDNIQVLISQAIDEARKATDLYPLNAGVWEGLAQIYRALVGLAKDSENWSESAYQRAVALDLFNPALRINLGGLYYQLERYDDAVEQFKAAVNLKSNYANAYYNLAHAYIKQGKKDLAISALETTLKLTSPEAQGYSEAKSLLDSFKK